MLRLPEPVLERREGYGRQNLMASPPKNTPTSGERRARPEGHLGNAGLQDAWLQPGTEENNVVAPCLSFSPVEQELELLLNFAGQQNKTKRLIGCILKWLHCSEEKKLICCSLKTKWPTLLPGDNEGLAASSTHRLGQPVLAPGGVKNQAAPIWFGLSAMTYALPFYSQSFQSR